MLKKWLKPKYARSYMYYARSLGFKKATLLAANKILGDAVVTQTAGGYLNVFDVGNYKEDIKKYPALSIPLEEKSTVPFVWYVPYWANVWGGGHLTIFRFAHFLSQLGHPNTIYIYDENCRGINTEELKNSLNKALPGNSLTVISSPEEFPKGHYLAFATTWQSAYEVIKYSARSQKFYFMQDYESYFYAFGTQSLQANASYQLGFHGITGGTWLKKCFESHGGSADNYIFSVDPACFYARENIGSEIKKLFFYGRPSTERRAYELGISTLREINKRFPDIEIVIAGLDGLSGLDFPAKLLGNLSLKATGDLYRTCDVGIALSGTNLSYLPVELMACGVPVITNNGPNVEWFCQNGENSLACDPFPSSFIKALESLIESRDLRTSLAQNGLNKISQTSWENEAQKILGFIHKAIY